MFVSVQKHWCIWVNLTQMVPLWHKRVFMVYFNIYTDKTQTKQEKFQSKKNTYV